MRVRSRSPVNENEDRFAQRGVIENSLQLSRIGACKVEISATARACMNVNCETKPSCLSGDDPKQEILNFEGLSLGGHPALRVPLVDLFCLIRFRNSEGERPQVGGFEFECRGSTFLL